MKVHLDTQALEQAIRRNPQVVKDQVGIFLARGRSMYMRSINQAPWRLGGSGGGVPIDIGNLKGSHRESMSPWQWRVDVSEQQAPYAKYVHGGTRKMDSRPWLDYAVESNERTLEQHQKTMLDAIIGDMAR